MWDFNKVRYSLLYSIPSIFINHRSGYIAKQLYFLNRLFLFSMYLMDCLLYQKVFGHRLQHLNTVPFYFAH